MEHPTPPSLKIVECVDIQSLLNMDQQESGSAFCIDVLGLMNALDIEMQYVIENPFLSFPS